MRVGWDSYFVKMAEMVSERSTCCRQHVGAVLIKDHRVLSIGYNGAPSGVEHCLEIGCNRPDAKHGEEYEKCVAVHAEMNCIISAARYGVSTVGATLYCTHQPCLQCAKAIINAGIVKVLYKHDLGMSNELFEAVDVDVVKCLTA